MCAAREEHYHTTRRPLLRGRLEMAWSGHAGECMCYVTDAIDARGELKWGLDLVWFVWGSRARTTLQDERGATRADSEENMCCERLVCQRGPPGDEGGLGAGGCAYLRLLLCTGWKKRSCGRAPSKIPQHVRSPHPHYQCSCGNRKRSDCTHYFGK